MEFLVVLLAYFGGALVTTYLSARMRPANWNKDRVDRMATAILWPLTLVALVCYALIVWPMQRVDALGIQHRDRVKRIPARDVQSKIRQLEKELKL